MRDRRRVQQLQEKKLKEREEYEWLKSYQKSSKHDALGIKPSFTGGGNSNEDNDSDEDIYRSNKGSADSVDEAAKPSSPIHTAPAAAHAKKGAATPPRTPPPKEQPRQLKGGSRPTQRSTDVSVDEGDEDATQVNSLSGLGIDVQHKSNNSAPASGPASASASAPAGAGASSQQLNNNGMSAEFTSELQEKIRRLELLEKSIQEKEQSMVLAAKMSAEKAEEVDRKLKAMEERAKKDEADRLAREELLAMAAGPISHRSPYSSIPGHQAGMSTSARRSMPNTARSQHSAPPTAR